MRTVLWGRRRGELQYNSRDYWRRNIPIGAVVMRVGSVHYFDVGDMVACDGQLAWVVGMAPRHLGVRIAA